MPITLPHKFDTSNIPKLILRGVVLLILLLLFGILYSAFISHETAAIIQLLIIAAITGYFGHLFHTHLIGSVGTIFAEVIEVKPAQLFGINLTSPHGKFLIGAFTEVRVELIPISFANKNSNHPHARVIIAGKAETPDILIARTSFSTGKRLGNQLAKLVKLPYQEQLNPH